ncbi:hypothetical protein AHF37_05674 [Paragonimus kellicotti]|nr:hypothetical protein AHF37_05674 [Paragonimus kellicotti]
MGSVTSHSSVVNEDISVPFFSDTNGLTGSVLANALSHISLHQQTAMRGCNSVKYIKMDSVDVGESCEHGDRGESEREHSVKQASSNLYQNLEGPEYGSIDDWLDKEQ